MFKFIIKISIVLLLIFFGMAYFNGNTFKDSKVGEIVSNVSQLSPPGPPSLGELMGAENNVREINITAKQWAFEPNIIRVNKGDKVILHINSLDVKHGFALPDFKIAREINPGMELTIEFVADKTGSFDFFCNVACGRGHGSMEGVLIVE